LSPAARSAPALPQAEWSHHCSACGKCCNSAPQLTVPELFHHQDTFFGCLLVQRVPYHSQGQALADQLLHVVPGSLPTADRVLLATQAFDLELSARCPALNADQQCSLHGPHKPGICRVVPFDALLPDSLQHLVLAERAKDTLYIGSDCIAAGIRPGLAVVTRRLRVVEDDARVALAERRRDLAAERLRWGELVFQALLPELSNDGPVLERLPREGFMRLSIAPVLMVIAEASERARMRCVAYLKAQAVLAHRILADARRAGVEHAESVVRLAAFQRTNERLHARLSNASSKPQG